jgi:hypothetical protein
MGDLSEDAPVDLPGRTPVRGLERPAVADDGAYPNHIPPDEAPDEVTVLDIARRTERFAFDRVYAGWRERPGSQRDG